MGREIREVAVVSNCANPECAVPFRVLRDGRLFQFEVKSSSEGAQPMLSAERRRLLRRVWHYWLCGSCSSRMTLSLSFDRTEGLRIVPRIESLAAAAS